MNKNINWQEQGKKENPFKVPDGYFEGLENRILDRINEEKSEEKLRILSPKLIRWISGVAAVLLLSFVGFQQFHLKPQKLEHDQELMFAVIEYYAQDLDETTFATLMAENDVFYEEEMNTDIDLIEYMDVDDLAIIEAIVNGY